MKSSSPSELRDVRDCYALCPVVSVDPAFAGPAATRTRIGSSKDVR